jgi:hypothetical protein
VSIGTELSTADFESMDLLDRTELLQTLLGAELEEHVTQRFRDAVPALSHALLASLRCEAAVTTNYDRCYELAVQARHLEIFLDVVAAHACHDTPYFLHPHFEDLLNDDEESALAVDARGLAEAIDAAVATGRLRQDAGWTALLGTLRRMGALGDPPRAL